MKIGVLTWWRNNYGSILQAYALQQVINEKEDLECEIISQYDKNPATAANFINKIRQIGIKDAVNRAFWRFFFPKLKGRSVSMQKFISDNLNVSDINYNNDTIYNANNVYDGFICGSDQIWNPSLTRTDSIYWLKFVEKNKLKMSYAPSIGVTSLDKETEEKIAENLLYFDAVSCRELAGTEYLSSIMKNGSCCKVVDPTLLVSKKVWDKISDDHSNRKPYIFVYFLRCSAEQRKMVEKFADQKGLDIVNMPFLEAEYIEKYDFKFGDEKVWDASPADFISLIRNSEYVFTDSFHASVFSIIYHRTFYVFPKNGKSQMQRLISLLEENGIGNRIINNYDDIICQDDIIWSEVENKISDNRSASENYLFSNIFMKRSN